jgi:dipeptidyl aminopeptidase/acylaminoacyl peptidase
METTVSLTSIRRCAGATVLLALCAALLIACDNGDSSAATPPAPTPASTPVPGASTPAPPADEQPAPSLPSFVAIGDPAEALPFWPDSFGLLHMDWNHDRSALLYVQEGDIWVWRDGSSTNLTNTPAILEGMPRWSPNGDWIAFASRPFVDGEEPQALVGPQGGPATMRADGSDYLVQSTGSMLTAPAWGPDGRYAAFAVDGEVLLYEPTGSEVTRISAAIAGLGDSLDAVDWSMPGRIAVAFADGRGELVEGQPARIGYALLSMDGLEATVLLEWETDYVPLPQPRWSHSGDALLIVVAPASASLAPDYPSGVWVADVLTQEVRRVEGLTPYQATWSPDSDRIAVIENGDRRILILDARTFDVLEQPGPAMGVEGIAW